MSQRTADSQDLPPVVRIYQYHHLFAGDLRPPRRPQVFFDPADTEVGIWSTVDLLKKSCTVLDLGCGSGAAAAAVARAGAGHVHGLDISQDSIQWACQHYAVQTKYMRVSFEIADYTKLSTSQLLNNCPFEGSPTVVVSNPPYVPVQSMPGCKKVSIDGGLDGLRFVRIVAQHAAELGSDLGLTIGSYSSPRAAASLLDGLGYQISSVTLSALRLGDFTVRNMDRVLELEMEGEGPLLRTGDGVIQYLVVGLSCRRIQRTAGAGRERGVTPDELLALLHRACQSQTPRLETLSASSVTWPVPIRILVLPDETRRHHC